MDENDNYQEVDSGHKRKRRFNELAHPMCGQDGDRDPTSEFVHHFLKLLGASTCQLDIRQAQFCAVIFGCV